MYRSGYSYVRFSRYRAFFVITPGVPQGFFILWWVTPHGVTHQPASCTKLNQRRPQIWGPFCSCPYGLGDPALPLSWALFVSLFSSPTVALLFLSPLAWYRGQLCSAGLWFHCSFVGPLVTWPQTVMAASIAPSLEGLSTLGMNSVHSGSCFLVK